MRASDATATWEAAVAHGEAARGTGRDEGELLAQFARGSREAAEALVEASYPFVFASCARLVGGDPELAADLTQETYRRAWAALGTCEKGLCPSGKDA